MKLNTVLRLALCSLHSLSLTGILHAGDVVAVVDESPVYLYEVYPHPDVVESLLLDAQVDNFIQHIENMVIEDAVRSYGIVVDESDVRDYKRQHGVNNDINEPDYNDQIREQALNAKKHAHFNDWLRRQVVTTPVELRDSDLKRALRLKGVSLLHVGEEIDEEKKLPLAPIPVD